MPATPTPLLVSWPIVPLTCVPCPSRSNGRSSSQMKSRGDTNLAVAELGRRRETARRRAERRIDRPACHQPEREARVVADDGDAEGDAAVEHGDDDLIAGLRLDVPRPLHVDRREVPLPVVERVVRPQHRVVQIARLRVFDVGPRAELAATASGSASAGMVRMSKSAYEGRSIDAPDTARIADTTALCGAVAELHDDRTWQDKRRDRRTVRPGRRSRRSVPLPPARERCPDRAIRD